MNKGGTLYYLASDHLGGTSLITNAGGQLVSRERYYPYGMIRTQEYSAPPTDKLYTPDGPGGGQQRETTNGLYHYGARLYNADIGRFISADTIVPGAGNPQALNRYSYVLNNPLHYSDPSGHCPMDDGPQGGCMPRPPGCATWNCGSGTKKGPKGPSPQVTPGPTLCGLVYDPRLCAATPTPFFSESVRSFVSEWQRLGAGSTRCFAGVNGGPGGCFGLPGGEYWVRLHITNRSSQTGDHRVNSFKLLVLLEIDEDPRSFGSNAVVTLEGGRRLVVDPRNPLQVYRRDYIQQCEGQLCASAQPGGFGGEFIGSGVPAKVEATVLPLNISHPLRIPVIGYNLSTGETYTTSKCTVPLLC